MKYKGQCILLDWFRSQGNDTVSKSRLNRICKSIEITLFNNLDQYKLENYINPLLAIGLLEFQQNNKYCLAPTIAIKSTEDTVLVNFPTNKLSNDCPIIEKSYSGHLIRVATKTFKLNLECAYNNYNQNILIQHPTLKQIVENWESCDSLFEGYETECLKGHSWQKAQLIRNGVYRIKEKVGSQKILKLGDYTLLIPAHNSIDSFAIAYQLTNPNDPFSYNVKSKRLDVNTFLFPIIIQRLLIHISHFRFEYIKNNLSLCCISNKNFRIIKSKFNA